jgi:hypothetical protein
MDVKEYIKQKRDTLGNSSITTYASILRNLYKKVYGDGDIDLKKFEKPKETLKFLEDMPPNRRKTVLSALVIITDNKEYRDKMLEDVRNYNADINKQQKSESQEENWVQGGELKSLYADIKQNADLLYKKKNLTMEDMQNIQSYIILSVLGGFFIPPRRSKDYCDFKIKNVDQTKDNYMDKNAFFFNSYKTQKYYGKQSLDIPVPLKNIIRKWITINPTDYLLFDSNGNQLTSVKLNQRLNKLFGKKASVNALRHTYLTDKYEEHMKVSKKLANEMTDMGSSGNMAKTYIKED